MGTMRIQIDVTGIHHNNNPRDTDVMTRKFVADLSEAGHIVNTASIVAVAPDGKIYNEPEDLMKPVVLSES